MKPKLLTLLMVVVMLLTACGGGLRRKRQRSLLPRSLPSLLPQRRPRPQWKLAAGV